MIKSKDFKETKYNKLGERVNAFGSVLSDIGFTLSFSLDTNYIAIIDNETKETVNCLELMDKIALRNKAHIINEDYKKVEFEIGIGYKK